MNLKQNKGIGITDAIIAVAILMIFTGLVVTISYNIYIQSNFVKRNEQATNYIVEVFEYAQGLIYENVDTDTLVDYVSDKYHNVTAINGEYIENTEKLSGYTIFINVTDIYEDYIKQMDITCAYNLGIKTKTVNMSTLISK